VTSTPYCIPDEICAWWKLLFIVFSVTCLHTFSTHQIASNSVIVCSCFSSVHEIILSSTSLQKWHFRFPVTPWSKDCILVFFSFSGMGCTRQSSMSSSFFFFYSCSSVQCPSWASNISEVIQDFWFFAVPNWRAFYVF
jgi:hypothetical protein